MKKTVQVAIALICCNEQILIGWRDQKLHQGGCYEFAGGKIEANETPMEACRREVQEEVGISIDNWQLYQEIIHEYDDKIVHLHFLKSDVSLAVTEQISAPWQWVKRADLHLYAFPEANENIIDQLQQENI